MNERVCTLLLWLASLLMPEAVQPDRSQLGREPLVPVFSGSRLLGGLELPFFLVKYRLSEFKFKYWYTHHLLYLS